MLESSVKGEGKIEGIINIRGPNAGAVSLPFYLPETGRDASVIEEILVFTMLF